MTELFEDLMRTQDPARGFPGYTRDDRDHLIGSVTTAPTPLGNPTPVRRDARSARRLGVGIAAAAALIALGLVTQAILPIGTVGSPQSAAALDRLAQAIPEVRIPDDSYELTVATSSWISNTSGRRLTDTRRTWLAPDGWSWAQETGDGDHYHLLPALCYPWSLNGAAPDPAAMVDYLRTRVTGSSSTDEAVFDAITTHLRESAVSADLRAAAIHALALIEHVTVTENAVDPAGRPATKVDFIDPVNRPNAARSFYFDPANSQILADEYLLDGAADSWTIVTERRIVDAIPAEVTSKLGTERVFHSVHVMPDGSLEVAPGEIPDEFRC
ncbi:MAG: hypothetical protein LCH76_04280 [Actinobacteria bacterium]|nr:hypothetical protein [Actinomycetota bacterium]